VEHIEWETIPAATPEGDIVEGYEVYRGMSGGQAVLSLSYNIAHGRAVVSSSVSKLWAVGGSIDPITQRVPGDFGVYGTVNAAMADAAARLRCWTLQGHCVGELS
jgi:hypothetical protein